MQQVLRGSRREETTRFLAFRSHWRFDAEFCTPAEGHEKGGVENEVGGSGGITGCRCPQAGDLEELNRSCWPRADADEARDPTGGRRASARRC